MLIDHVNKSGDEYVDLFNIFIDVEMLQCLVKTRALVTFAIIASLLIICAPSLLTGTNTINNNSHNLFLQHAFATHMDLTNSTETTILHQGIIASGKPPQIKTSPNETVEVVTILPFRDDGSIYKGVLTYTATEPVEITLGHVIAVDNTTLSQLDTEKYGNLFLRHLTANVEGNISAPSKIIPDYRGSTPPFFSASVPFVASQVVLRSNEPFIAAYEVSADIVQPEIIRHLENATVTSTNSSTIG
jgi:hypothetical protein